MCECACAYRTYDTTWRNVVFRVSFVLEVVSSVVVDSSDPGYVVVSGVVPVGAHFCSDSNHCSGSWLRNRKQQTSNNKNKYKRNRKRKRNRNHKRKRK